MSSYCVKVNLQTHFYAWQLHKVVHYSHHRRKQRRAEAQWSPRVTWLLESCGDQNSLPGAALCPMCQSGAHLSPNMSITCWEWESWVEETWKNKGKNWLWNSCKGSQVLTSKVGNSRKKISPLRRFMVMYRQELCLKISVRVAPSRTSRNRHNSLLWVPFHRQRIKAEVHWIACSRPHSWMVAEFMIRT